ncbi:MAG: gliding motility-associated protein GldE [Muribaculaceae bacterium]|nr:gliding motility-associated protein GldE [Muribaculaceae bacterium]
MDPDPLSCVLTTLCNVPVNETAGCLFNVPSTGSIIAIVVALLCLALSAFNSGAEIAYFSLTPDEIEEIENEERRNRVKKLLSTPEKLLATILIGNNIVNIAIVILLNFALNQILVLEGVANFVVQTIILTFIILLFGEVLPKLYATSHNGKFAAFTSAGLSVMMHVLSPLSRLMVKSTYIVRKVVSERADDISMEDLSKALEVSDVKNEEEKDLLQGILTFGDKTVAEIMTPRIDIVDLDREMTFGEVVKEVVKTGYSRMPVYEENQDNIKGVLYAKDLLPYIGKSDNDTFKWQTLLRPAYYVPETRRIDDLLEDFRKKKIHMAIVVDEFGCTQGIATLEDVLEEIVGDIDDEYDDTEEKFYSRVAENTYIFDAKTPLDDFIEVTGIDEKAFDPLGDDAETVAGLLLAAKGDFLKEKEEITCGPCKFTVLKVKKYRIAKVKVVIEPAPTTDN